MPDATNIHSGAGSSSPSEAIQAENARLQALIDHPPQEILTLSDFHLGCGRNPSTGRFSRTENFLSDQAFSRLLTYSKAGAEKLLFINGDTFDFARIFRCPSLQEDFQEWSAFLQQLGVMKDAAELQKTVSRREKRFGLETDDYKSAWKLLQIANGHREFFVALANWINAGGLLLLSKGNHDLELYWPLVRKAFGVLMQREGAREDAVRTQVFYCDDSLRIGNIYFEHGHRYDPEQRIEGGPVMATNPDKLSLPLGIFVNRYLINQLEKLEPFLGSVRPTERILWMLLRRHPIAAMAILFRSLRFIRRAFQTSRIRDFFWYAVYIGSIAVPLVTALAIVIVGIFVFAHGPGQFLVKHQRLLTVLSVLGMFAPYLAAAFRELVRRLQRKREPQVGEDGMAAGVYKTIHDLKFPPARQIYAVMGHTHDQDVQRLPDINGVKVLYLNTGTWIPVWPDDRPDLNGQVLFPFVSFRRGQDGEYHHQYLEWRDDRGGPAKSYILEPPEN